MKRSGEFLVIVCILLIFSCFGVFAYEFNVSNLSINENYAMGEYLSGSFFLNLTDASADIMLRSELGNTSVRDVLIANGYEPSCESYNCSDLYNKTGLGEGSKQITASSLGRTLGLYVVGNEVVVNNFNLNIASDFQELNFIPFSIKVADDYIWDFDYPSLNWENSRAISNGCFNPSVAFTEKVIDSFGYCEQVNLNSSRAYYLKANISGSSSITDFKMSLNKNGEEIESCDFSNYYANYSNDVGCVVDLSQQLEAGSYDVCIRSYEDLSNYTIKKEIAGVSCGYYKNSTARTADYSLYVLTPKYDSLSGSAELGSDFSESASDSMNYYLMNRYPNGCEEGCVIPITFYGQGVVLDLSDISLRYSTMDGPEENKNINEVSMVKPKIDFSDFLFIDGFEWIVDSFGSSNLSVYLDDGDEMGELFVLPINVLDSPLVKAVYPTNPPAGVNVYFYADVLYNFSKLEWNFGDGSPVVNTTVAAASHIYENVSQLYEIAVTAYGENYSTTRYFIVETVSPENYLNVSLDFKRNRLASVSGEIDLMPSLYKEFIRELANITSFTEQLNQIESDRVLAYTPDQFLGIVQRLTTIIVPYSIFTAERRSGSLGGDLSLIDPSLVSSISPGNYTNLDSYKNLIVGWQSANFDMRIVKEKLKIYYENNDVEDLISVYNINLTSRANETAYFIIQESLENLHLPLGISGNDLGGKATYLEIPAGESLNFEFFVDRNTDVVMFVSPKLKSLSIGNIAPCNFNKICQKGMGENYKNCRSDCKPVWPTILWLILVLVFVLIIYTCLQVWYKIRYEKSLFRDRIFLFNLVAFINNSKLKNLSHGDIYSILYQKNWSSEQISYAIKKSEGRNTGMYEIIPIDRLVAYFEMKKAQKVKEQGVSTPVNPFMMKNNFPNRQFSRGSNINGKNNFRKL